MVIDIKLGVKELFCWQEYTTMHGRQAWFICPLKEVKDWLVSNEIAYRFWNREPTDDEQNDPKWIAKYNRARGGQSMRYGDDPPVRKMWQIVFTKAKHAVLFKLYWSEYL